MRTVALSLTVLGITAIFQLCVYVASGSVSLLADLIHNSETHSPPFLSPAHSSFGRRLAERRAGVANALQPLRRYPLGV
jgi:hypothetical protein